MDTGNLLLYYAVYDETQICKYVNGVGDLSNVQYRLRGVPTILYYNGHFDISSEKEAAKKLPTVEFLSNQVFAFQIQHQNTSYFLS